MFEIVDLVLLCLFASFYAWVFYNLSVLAFGVRSLRKNKLKVPISGEASLPSFSILVPVKNEAPLIRRLMMALSNLSYPKDKVEIIFVESGSSDGTLQICEEHARKQANLKVVKGPRSNGKPSALNFGLGFCKGDIVAVFDADNIPAGDVLMKAAQYFKDSAVAAVQGRTMSINAKENMLTQFVSYEEAVGCEGYLRGKDALGLFVPLKGTCQFVRRNVLQELSGFDVSSLAEDLEFSARLAEKGYNTRYGEDVCAWQESVSNLKMFFKQRVRWSRGTMEVAFRYGRLMAKPCKRNFDAEITLFAPFIIIVSLLFYFAPSGLLFSSFPPVIWRVLTIVSFSSTAVMILMASALLYCFSSQKRSMRLLWLPFVFGYWCLQVFIALYAAILILLRRPKVWLKTEKQGSVTKSDLLRWES